MKTYLVTLDEGSRHPEYTEILKNLLALGVRSRDSHSFERRGIIFHRQDEATVHLAVTDGIEDRAAVSVEKINPRGTSETDKHWAAVAREIKKRPKK